MVGEGTVPANLTALVWAPYQTFQGDLDVAGSSSVSWVASDGERVPFRLELRDTFIRAWVLLPERPLREGITYHLEQPSFCEGLPTHPRTSLPVRVVAAAPLPTTLGTLTVGTATVSVVELSHENLCSTLVLGANARVELDLSTDALPWRDAFMFETYVDGQYWAPRAQLNHWVPAGRSWVGRGSDRIYGLCPSTTHERPGLTLGVPHTVTMRATIPGTDVVVETAPVTVTLSCPGPGLDAGLADVGSADAGSSADASSFASGSSEGCTCWVVSERSTAAWLVLGLVLVSARRRSSRGA